MAVIPLTQVGPADGENFEHQWAGEYVQAHLLSDVGKKREHNEDSCVLCTPEDVALAEQRGLLLAVADGMGGASAGECASRMALETIVEKYYTSPSGSVPDRLREALEDANSRVFEESEAIPEYHGMGTTASVLVVHGDCAYIAQVGDSRVYVSRGKEGLLQITHDHSLVAEQVRSGYISAEEARNHSLKNLITRAVGIKSTVKIDLFSFRLKQGDTMLICSDGLSNLVKDEEISRVLEMDNLQGAARILVGRALDEGGSDNVTAVLVRVTQSPQKYTIEEGAEEVSLPKTGIMDKFKGLLGKR